MVLCLVLVSALLLASVWAPVECQLGIIVQKCRQRRPVNVCATALRSVGKPIKFLTMGYICTGSCIFAIHIHAHAWYPECPRTRLQIVTRNTTLLSPSNITATRYLNNFYPPGHFGNFTRAVWCAPAGPNPNINLSFSQLVLITGFIPGGYSRNNGSNREYVTNFNLRYSENLDGNEFSSSQVRTDC